MTTAVLAMVGLAAASWVLRILFVALVPARQLPERVQEALGYLAPAVLAALVAVETASAMSGGDTLVALLLLLVVVIIVTVVRLTGSLLLAVAVGLGAALLLDLVLG